MNARRCARWVLVLFPPHFRSAAIKLRLNDWDTWGGWHVVHRRHRSVPT